MKGFKVFRRLTALLLTVAMLLSLGVGAFATEADVEVLSTEKSATKAAVDAKPEGLYFGFGNSEGDQVRYSGAAFGDVNYDTTSNWNDAGNVKFSNKKITSGMFTGDVAAKDPYIRAAKGASTASASNYTLNYTIREGDVVQMRYRISNSSATSVNLTVFLGIENADGSVTVNEDTKVGGTYNIVNGEFAIQTISLAAFVGKKMRTTQLTFRGISDGKVDIDYAYFGPKAKAPVFLNYYNGNTLLYGEYVGYGMGGTYHPAGTLNGNDSLTYYNGWRGPNGEYYNSAGDICVTKPMKVTTSKDTLNPNEMMSNKYLSTGSDTLDDQFSIILDAYSYGKPTTIKSASPLDITLILDRSASMSFPADKTKNWSTKNMTIDQIIAEMDKVRLAMGDKFYDGYFRASNWLTSNRSTAPYAELKDDYPHDGWGSWEPIRYYDPDGDGNGEWQMWVVDDLVSKGVHSFSMAFGIVYWEKSLNAMNYGSWVELKQAKKTHDTRMSNKGKSGYYFTVTLPRLTMAINSISDFIDEINESSKLLPEGTHHTISILSYGTTAMDSHFKYYGDDSVKFLDFQDQGVSITTKDLDTNYDAIMTALRKYYVMGNTLTSWAFETVSNTKTSEDAYIKTSSTDYGYLAPKDDNRSRVVIFLTDGLPTAKTKSEFNADSADEALVASSKIKATGTPVYAIGFMSDLSATATPVKFASSQSNSTKANTFLTLISSNYKTATSMQTTAFGDRAEGNYYLVDKGDGTDLADHFNTILSEVTTSTSALASSLAIHDELTREFKVDAKRDASVYIAPYLGNGKFGDRVLLGQHNLDSLDGAMSQATEYSLSWNEATMGLTLIWKDAKYGYLRENDVENDGCHPEYKKGYKIMIELPIEVNRENTIGGNNIITNTDKSGLYNVDENGNLVTEKQKLDSNGKPVTDANGKPVMEPASIIIYNQPNANVTTDVELFAHDYFMDMDTLMKILDLQDRTATIQDIFMDLISAKIDMDNAAGESKLDHVKEIRVQIIDPITGEVICELVAPQGTTDFVVDWCVDVKDFNFMIDQTFKVTAEIVQKDTSAVDSVNVTQFPNEKADELAPNYFSPKVAIIDFDGVISVPMQKEADTQRLTYNEPEDDDNNDGKLDNNDFYAGIYDAESGCIKYDLRPTYGSDNQPAVMNRDYRAFDYTFEAINPRKGATLTNGKDIVSRRLLILPANVMTYDDEVLWGVANWKETGDAVQGVQEFDNTLRHGYDPNFVNVDGDLHGSARYATVSEKNNNKTMSTQFWGTGFEVLSRTGKDSGAMLVEVRRISDYNPETGAVTSVNPNGSPAGEIYKVYLVNTYLDGDTLYQIPVVQTTDLPYGAYRVNIYAYYNKAFDQNYTKKSVMTEEKAREILGLDASVDFTYIPSVSEAASVAKRDAAPEATEGQYNVYVDGMRVYNTRGDLTFMENSTNATNRATHRAMNRVFQYVYSFAGEFDMITGGTAKFENVSDLIIDAGSNVDWSAEGTEGVLYIAGRGNADSDDTVNTNTDGFMLNMSGKIEFVTEGGKNYPVYKDSNGNTQKYYHTYTYSYEVTKDGKTETVTKEASAPIYYKVNANGTRDYYAVLKTGENTEAETMLTWDVVRNLLGQNGSVVYYDSKYDLMGPEHEIYIPAPEGNSYRGIAFNVANASKVMISAKSVNGATTLEAFAGNDTWTAIKLNGKTELYFDVPVVDGAVILRNAGENIVSVCNIKMIGNNADATPKVFVKPSTMMLAINLFNNETPILADGVQMSHSLTLESGISINYVAKAEQLDKYDSFYMEVIAPVYEGNEQVGTETYRLEPTAVGDLYYFVMDEIAAKQMNDVMQARIYMTKDGATYVSRLDEYSIATYAYNQLVNEKASEELKALCVNLLRYGAEAQKYWGYRTDSLADEEIAAEFAGLLTELDSIELESKKAMLNDVEAPVASWMDASLVLESKIVMRFTANLAEFDGNVEDLTACFTFVNHEGETVVEEVKDFTVRDAEKKLYNVYCDAIDADELRVVVSAAIFCGDTQISCTAQYSVESYAARVTGSVVTLCKAMMAYGDSVEAFFN